MDSTEEASRLVVWDCKVSLIDLQRKIFLKIHALKRKREQERLSMKDGSSFHPLRHGRISPAQLHQSRDRKTALHLHPLNSIRIWRVK